MLKNRFAEVEWYDAVDKKLSLEVIDLIEKKSITGKQLLAINKTCGRILIKNKDVIIIRYEESTDGDHDFVIVPTVWIKSIKYLE